MPTELDVVFERYVFERWGCPLGNGSISPLSPANWIRSALCSWCHSVETVSPASIALRLSPRMRSLNSSGEIRLASSSAGDSPRYPPSASQDTYFTRFASGSHSHPRLAMTLRSHPSLAPMLALNRC